MLSKVGVVTCVLLSCCASYKYKYVQKESSIVSVKGNPISLVLIKTEEGEEIARFKPIGEKSSAEFSLKTFSPGNFNCFGNCPFNFEKGKTYLAIVHPMADRMLLPIKLKVQTDGNIVEQSPN